MTLGSSLNKDCEEFVRNGSDRRWDRVAMYRSVSAQAGSYSLLLLPIVKIEILPKNRNYLPLPI
ncbi:hypothetical protein [Chamaesiphon sp.]|uniref:hypothetical protein n=1 Tax=Chamaesiphon sp. TaxID=2814140 RepID=UPI003594852A